MDSHQRLQGPYNSKVDSPDRITYRLHLPGQLLTLAELYLLTERKEKTRLCHLCNGVVYGGQVCETLRNAPPPGL